MKEALTEDKKTVLQPTSFISKE